MGRFSRPAPPRFASPSGSHYGRWRVSNDADIRAFLALLPIYERKELEHGLDSLTPDELNQWAAAIAATPNGLVQHAHLTAEYERLLQRDDANWKEYRKQKKQEFHEEYRKLTTLLPKGKAGRPRLDERAAEFAELKKSGLSHEKIAIKFNQKHAAEIKTRTMAPATSGGVRKLISSRTSTDNISRTKFKN